MEKGTNKLATIRKRRNQKEIPTPKTEVGKLGAYTYKTYLKPSEQLFPNRRSLSYPNLNKKFQNVHKVQVAQKFDSKT